MGNDGRAGKRGETRGNRSIGHDGGGRRGRWQEAVRPAQLLRQDRAEVQEGATEELRRRLMYLHGYFRGSKCTSSAEICKHAKIPTSDITKISLLIQQLLNQPRSLEASKSSACPCPSPQHSPAHPNRNHHRRKPKHELLLRSACAQAHPWTPSCSPCSPCHQTNSNEASWYPPRQSKRHPCAPQP